MSAGKKANSALPALLSRHAAALGYVFGVLLPLILRTRKRPVIFSRWIGMGDIICTIPAARELMKRHPGRFFIYNCQPDFADVPRLGAVAGLVTSLEAVGVVGHWYRFLLAGFYHFAHGDDTSGKVAQEPMVAEFLRQFGLPVTDAHPQLSASSRAREKVGELLVEKNVIREDLILIHPGPSWPVKEWPLEKWAQLVSGLRAAGFSNIAQLGVSRYLISGPVTVELVPGTASLVDQLSIEETVALMAQAKLFVGIDSGLLHIAAATRTPAVGIFGATLPQFLYAANVRKDFVVGEVECIGCFHRLPRLNWLTNCPYEIKCMKTLSASRVLVACLEKLMPLAAGPGQRD